MYLLLSFTQRVFSGEILWLNPIKIALLDSAYCSYELVNFDYRHKPFNCKELSPPYNTIPNKRDIFLNKADYEIRKQMQASNGGIPQCLEKFQKFWFEKNWILEVGGTGARSTQ